MNVALLNTNQMQPPIAPIGLDYVAEALHAAGHSVSLLDLCWEDNPKSAINRFFNNSDYGLVGGKDPFDPLFFLEPQIVRFVFDWINAINGNDDNFLFFDPSRTKQNSNYHPDKRMIESIAQGYQSAFRDILGLSPPN